MGDRLWTFAVVLLAPVACAAGYAQNTPHRSVYDRDVDANGKPERFTYEVKEADGQHNQASLTIRSAAGHTFYDHEWTMTRADSINDLLVQESAVSSRGRSLSVEEWVKHFFDGSLNYGAVLHREKLQVSDLDNEQLDFAAEQLRTTASRLKEEILSQKMNTTFSYRAEWREDLMQLVYLPATRKFITFARGCARFERRRWHKFQRLSITSISRDR